MLSKILTGSDANRARPAVFAHAGPIPAKTPATEQDSAEEVAALKTHIRRLESEMTAAKQEAFEAGKRQGEQSARAEISAPVERMNASVASLIGLRRDLRGRAENDVVQIALLIAKRILHRELSIDVNALTALARVVFDRLARTESYKISVHPRFAAAVQGAITGQAAGRVEVLPDPALETGAFVVRSAEGTIDASIDTQLEEIGRGLLDRLSE